MVIKVAESEKDAPQISDKSPDNNEKAGQGVDIVTGAEPEKNNQEGGVRKAVAIADANPDKAEGDGEALPAAAKPRVVASGKGAIAEQILQIAWANNIKVREDADLVEILSAIDVDSDIPIEAFAAVAEILSYLYRANAGHINFSETQENT